MTLVETSVWIGHFRNGNARLGHLLEQGDVLTHPFVVGELACGSVRNRDEVFHLLNELPKAPVALDSEALQLIETKKLWGRGIGWIDVHLLASAILSHSTLWTLDRRLASLSSRI